MTRLHLHRALEVLRRQSLLRVVVVAGLLSIVLVLAALPARRDGNRTAQNAHLPLRQPTGAEAVALIREGVDEEYPQSGIIGEEGENLVIGSRLYALPRDREDLGEERTRDEQESEYTVSSATWEPYYSVYRVPRSSYEEALGRELTREDFSTPYFVDEFTVSFDPRHIPVYAAVEVLFLTVWFTLLFSLVVRTRRPSALLPKLVPALFFPLLIVPFYSPALLDADWFYQRIIVEEIALFSAMVGGVAVLPAIASAVIFGSLVSSERLAKRRGKPKRVYRRRALASLLAVTVLFIGWRFASFRQESDRCVDDVDFVSERAAKGEWVDGVLLASPALPRTTDLMKEGNSSAEVQAVLRRLLEASGDRETHSVVILTPATGEAGEHLFMWRNGFLYADFRDLQTGFRSQIDSEVLDEIRKRGTHSTGFWRYFWGGSHRCGETLEVRGHSVLVSVSQPFSVGLLGL